MISLEGSNIKSFGSSACHWLYFRNGQELFNDKILGSRIFEFAINDVNGIKFTVFKSFYRRLCTKLNRFEGRF